MLFIVPARSRNLELCCCAQGWRLRSPCSCIQVVTSITHPHLCDTFSLAFIQLRRGTPWTDRQHCGMILQSKYIPSSPQYSMYTFYILNSFCCLSWDQSVKSQVSHAETEKEKKERKKDWQTSSISSVIQQCGFHAEQWGASSTKRSSVPPLMSQHKLPASSLNHSPSKCPSPSAFMQRSSLTQTSGTVNGKQGQSNWNH